MNPILRNTILSPQGITQRGLVGEYRFDDPANSQILYERSGMGINGQNGSTTGGDTNDVVFNGQYANFGGDDYIFVGNLNKEIRTLQIAWRTPTQITTASSPQTLVNLADNGGFKTVLVLGSSTAALANELISLNEIKEANVRSTWIESGGIINAGWHLTELIWDGLKYRIIHDRLEKPITVSGTPGVIIANNLSFGRRETPDRYFTGNIAFAVLSSESLSSARLEQNRKHIAKQLAQRGIVLP